MKKFCLWLSVFFSISAHSVTQEFGFSENKAMDAIAKSNAVLNTMTQMLDSYSDTKLRVHRGENFIDLVFTPNETPYDGFRFLINTSKPYSKSEMPFYIESIEFSDFKTKDVRKINNELSYLFKIAGSTTEKTLNPEEVIGSLQRIKQDLTQQIEDNYGLNVNRARNDSNEITKRLKNIEFELGQKKEYLKANFATIISAVISAGAIGTLTHMLLQTNFTEIATITSGMMSLISGALTFHLNQISTSKIMGLTLAEAREKIINPLGFDLKKIIDKQESIREAALKRINSTMSLLPPLNNKTYNQHESESVEGLKRADAFVLLSLAPLLNKSAENPYDFEIKYNEYNLLESIEFYLKNNQSDNRQADLKIEFRPYTRVAQSVDVSVFAKSLGGYDRLSASALNKIYEKFGKFENDAFELQKEQFLEWQMLLSRVAQKGSGSIESDLLNRFDLQSKSLDMTLIAENAGKFTSRTANLLIDVYNRTAIIPLEKNINDNIKISLLRSLALSFSATVVATNFFDAGVGSAILTASASFIAGASFEGIHLKKYIKALEEYIEKFNAPFALKNMQTEILQRNVTRGFGVCSNFFQ